MDKHLTLTRRCVLCQRDIPRQLCLELNRGKGVLIWACRRCWQRHKSQAAQMGLNNPYFLLRETLTRREPYETHLERVT